MKGLQEASASQQKSHHTALSLESEVLRLITQNKELKDGFSMMRDQVRAEQLSQENINALNRRLNEQIETFKFDAERLKNSREQEGDFYFPFYQFTVLFVLSFLIIALFFLSFTISSLYPYFSFL